MENGLLLWSVNARSGFSVLGFGSRVAAFISALWEVLLLPEKLMYPTKRIVASNRVIKIMGQILKPIDLLFSAMMVNPVIYMGLIVYVYHNNEYS